MKTLTLFLVFYSSFYFGNCSKIIFLMSFISPSHRIAFNPLIFELGNRGHEVTVVSPRPSTTHKNVKEIGIEGSNVNWNNIEGKETFRKYMEENPIISLLGTTEFYETACINYLKHPEVKKLLKSGKQFDVAMVTTLNNDCALATAPLLAKNIIYYSLPGLTPWTKLFVPTPYSYVPQLHLSNPSKMSFFQKINNFITHVGYNLVYDYVIISVMQKHLTALLPEAPTIFEAQKKVSFTLTSEIPVLMSPRPTMSNIVAVGGMQCGNIKPLSKEFEDIFQSAGDDGVILFSLGTNYPSSLLTEEKLESIFNAFSQLKQKVIWKFDTILENKPPNVMILKWIPQQELLAHPRMRLFITHGGLLGLQEAIYHGVPVVAIPLFADQPSNVARIEELKIGYKIDFYNISGENLFDAINVVLNDKTYAENVKKYSAIFKDQNKNILETAVFWIEYVIKHEGALHFRSAGHPKTRLFITHGGLLSLQESVYHGVPVVAIPLFADQPSNVARVEELKIGCKIDFHNLSGDSIYDAITAVLEDKSYSENVKKYSAIFKDLPQTAVDRAAFLGGMCNSVTGGKI